MRIEKLVEYIKMRIEEKFTGKITLNFYKGGVSRDIKREAVDKIEEN